MRLLDLVKRCIMCVRKFCRAHHLSGGGGNSVSDTDDPDAPFGMPSEQIQKLWFPIIVYVSGGEGMSTLVPSLFICSH
jgi:hypothetical protein